MSLTERFDSVQSFYCRNARGAVVCYGGHQLAFFFKKKRKSRSCHLPLNAFALYVDVTDRDSFEGVVRWVNKARTDGEPDCVVVLAATKLDLVAKNNPNRVERQVCADGVV